MILFVKVLTWCSLIFCNTFFKMYFKNILKLHLVGMLVDLNNLRVLEVFIFPMYFQRHLHIFFQNMRVVPPSRGRVFVLVKVKKSLIISSWSLYLNQCWTFQILQTGQCMRPSWNWQNMDTFFLHFQNILLKIFCSI